MKKTLLVLISFFLVVIFLLTGCISSREGPTPQVPQYANENEEFGIDPSYYKIEDYFSAQYAITMNDAAKKIFNSF